MVKVITLGIMGTILGILAGVCELVVYPILYTPQQLATMGYSTLYLYGTAIAAVVFSFIGMAGALVGERGLPSFILTPKYSYVARERTIGTILLIVSAFRAFLANSGKKASAILLIVGAIGVFFATSVIGLPSTILFVVAGVKMWRKKDETAIEQETDEAEQETDIVTY